MRWNLVSQCTFDGALIGTARNSLSELAAGHHQLINLHLLTRHYFIEYAQGVFLVGDFGLAFHQSVFDHGRLPFQSSSARGVVFRKITSCIGFMLIITAHLSLPLDEIEFTAVRSQGAGGQNVNKTSTAAHLRFDVLASSLPDDCKQRLLAQRDQRISSDGVIVIKAQSSRSLENNRNDALDRLRELIARAAIVPRKRKATKPTRSSKLKRLDGKTKRGALKAMRRNLDD